MHSEELKKLKSKACQIRKLTIDMIGKRGFGHVGGSMSIVEVMVLLYYKHMFVSPNDPKNANRDLFVMSKAHGGPTLYSILADKGFFPEEWLATLNQGGTHLPSHCDMNKTPGIDMTAGSLGQGLSVAVGMALGNRLDKKTCTVFALLSDGEMDEGQIWEAGMAAAHFGLNHLIAFTDHNKLQVDGTTDEIMQLGDLSAKWESFGWFVQRVDGHDMEQVSRAIETAKNEKDKPSMIILDTIKGKGVSCAENRVNCHHMRFDRNAAKEAILQLEAESICHKKK